MTLTTRLSLFFLGSLALTLAGFSLALYLLVAHSLDGQLDRQVESARVALTAVVEIKDDGVEWEPHERRLELPGVRWVALAPGGRLVSASPEPFPMELRGEVEGGNTPNGKPARVVSQDGQTWSVAAVRVAPDHPPGQRRGMVGAANREEGVAYDSLVLLAAAPCGPNEARVRQLGWALAGLSAAVWSAAAQVGRRLCRRALAPVARMAGSARSISAAEPGERLEVAATGDELEDLGRSFNGLLDRLQESFERQRRFTGEASHQLRTPLAVMLGQVEVALRRDRPPEEYRRVLGVVAEQAGRLHRLVEMLLFLARADAEAAVPGVSAVALGPWLQEHLKAWATHPRAADIRLDLSPEDLQALAHPALLGQVVDILLDNALKYSPAGSGVVVSLSADARNVFVAVEDAGCGIGAEDLPRVFEPFFRSPQLRESGADGVGLGLAIARRVCTAMGGEVMAQSRPGEGSRFTVRLRHDVG